MTEADSQSPLRYRSGQWSIALLRGDITTVVADALVNASNTGLWLGSGVSGALNRACGPGLQREMTQVGGIALDGMAVTGAHDLRTAQRILHVPTAGGEPSVVRRALDNVLEYCVKHGLNSVAIPALGTGVGGLAAAEFARLAVESLREVNEPAASCSVIFVLWDEQTLAALSAAMNAAKGVERTEG